MKNLKKVFALLVVFTMVLSAVTTVSFANTYSDVKDDAKYAEAVGTLSSLGLLKGDDAGNFNPDKTITRAEFSAVIARALGLGDPGKTATVFTDVAADHWGSGYIQLVSQMEIVKGYGGGQFGPEDPVTYEQAIKMIVAALGYTPKAEASGGYPTGYMVVAAQEGITNNANGKTGDPALRSVVATLVYNALEVPIMIQTGFGKDVSYEAQDGKGDRDYKTLLSEKFDITPVKAVIKDTKVKDNLGKNDSEKKIDLVNAEYKDADDYGTLLKNQTINSVKIGSLDVSDAVGYSIVAYVRDIEDEKELIAVTKRSGKNVSFEIEYDLVGVYNSTQLRQYEDASDVGTNEGKKIDLDSSAVYIVTNGMDVDEEDPDVDVIAGIIAESDGKVTFLDNDNDGDYDFIFVNNYKYIVVESVTSSGRVTNKLSFNATKAPRNYTFDKDDKADGDIDYKIIKDGKEIEATDLEEWDVLTMLQDSSEDITIAYVTTDVVSGTVTELSDEDNEDKPLFTLDGKNEYGIITAKSANGLTAITSGDLPSAGSYDNAVGKEYTFYLDKDGRIAYAEKGISTNGTKGNDNYAYLFKAAKTSGLDKTWQVELFTLKGEWAVYDIATKFDVNGTTYKMNGTNSVTTEDIATKGITNLLVEDSTAIRQIVTYKLDSSGKLKELNSSLKNTNDDDYVLLNYEYDINNKATYKKSTEKLGSYFFDSSTVIFAIDTSDLEDKDNYTVVTQDSFEDDEAYAVKLYDVDDNKEPGAIVAYNVEGSIQKDAPLFVIDSASQGKDSNDDTIYKLKGYENGELVNITVDGDATVYNLVYADDQWKHVGSTSVGSLKKGVVIQYNKGHDDMATKVRVVYNPNVDSEDYYVEDYASKVSAFGSDDDVKYYYGEVYKYSGGKITIGKDSGEYTVNVKTSNFIQVDSTGSSVKNKVDPDVDEHYKNNNNVEVNGSKVLLREYDGFIKDVLVIKD